MAQTLTATATAAAAKRFADLRFLLKIEFSKPYAKTLRLSTHHLPNCGAAEWFPLVIDWGAISSSFDIISLSARPETVTITLNNSASIYGRSRFSDYLYSAQNLRNSFQFANAKATLYQAFSDTADAADLVTLGVYYLEEPRDIGQSRLSLTMSDASLAVENAMQLLKVSTTNFTQAPPSALDKYIPVLFGDLTAAAKQVRAIPVVAGKMTRLSAAVTQTQTTAFSVDSTSGFPTSGDIMIGGEIIHYTSVTSTTFAGTITRAQYSSGVNGTAQTHASGDEVFEVRSGTSAYRYVLGMNILNGTKAAGTIYTNGRLLSSGATARLAVTTLVTGYSFAMIDFDVAATSTGIRQFHITPQGAERYLATDTPKSLLMTCGTGASAGVGTVLIEPTLPAAPTVGVAIKTLKFTVSVTLVSGTTPTDVYVGVGDHIVPRLFTLAKSDGTQYAVEWPFSAYDTQPNITFELSGSSAAATFTCTVHSAEAIFDQLSTSGAESTAAATIGDVTALTQGIQDDGSGSISGTASLLLENPADITKAIVTQLYATTAPSISTSDCGTTWATSRTTYTAKAYKWAFPLDFTRFSDLQQNVMRQGRALLYFSAGKIQCKFLDDGPTKDFSIDYDREVAADSPASLMYGDRSRILNSVSVSSQLDPTLNTYSRVILWEDLTQVGFPTALQSSLSLSYVQDATTADDIGRFWRDQWKAPRFESSFRSWWNITALEIGDVVVFTNHPLLLVHSSDLTFRVVGRRTTPSKGCTEVQLRVAPNFWQDREVYPRTVTNEPLWLFAPVPQARVFLEQMQARRDPTENAKAFGRRSRQLSAMGG